MNRKEYNHQYYLNNKEYFRLKSKKWAKKNPEKVQISLRRWVANNPDKVLALNEKWRNILRPNRKLRGRYKKNK